VRERRRRQPLARTVPDLTLAVAFLPAHSLPATLYYTCYRLLPIEQVQTTPPPCNTVAAMASPSPPSHVVYLRLHDASKHAGERLERTLKLSMRSWIRRKDRTPRRTNA